MLNTEKSVVVDDDDDDEDDDTPVQNQSSQTLALYQKDIAIEAKFETHSIGVATDTNYQALVQPAIIPRKDTKSLHTQTNAVVVIEESIIPVFMSQSTQTQVPVVEAGCKCTVS